MNQDDRTRAVRRVHDVIFSQVMAITHSMVELGCSPTLSREFLYRMCVIHQLGEAQRQQLLTHVLVSNNNAADDENENGNGLEHEIESSRIHDHGTGTDISGATAAAQVLAEINLEDSEMASV